MKNVLFGVFVITSVVLNANADAIKLKTPQGVEIDVIADYPANTSKKLPAVLIAPGQGYHMGLPLIEQFANAAVKNEVIAYRFNWGYFTKDPVNGGPSDDLSFEIQDMTAVLNAMKADPRVDVTKIVVAGKSLGTLVSYSIFQNDSSLKGLVLLTPICTQDNKPVGDEAYPEFSKQTRPIAMILGNADGACSLPMLYDFVKASPGNVTINVFAGGHSLTLGQPGDPANAEKDVKNVEAAASTAAWWAKLISM